MLVGDFHARLKMRLREAELRGAQMLDIGCDDIWPAEAAGREWLDHGDCRQALEREFRDGDAWLTPPTGEHLKARFSLPR